MTRKLLPGALVAVASGLLAGCLEEPLHAPPPVDTDGSPRPIPARVLVLNGLSETLSSLDPDTRQMTVQAATVGTWPNRVRPWTAGRAFLVTASGDNRVEILNARDLSFRQEIDFGPGTNPWLAIASNDGGSEGVATAWLSGEVRRIRLDRAESLPPVAVTPGPEGVAVDGDIAWVACTNWLGDEGTYGPGRLDVVDLSAGRVLASIEVGRNPQDVLLTDDGRVHVLCTGTYGGGPDPETGSVHVVDPTAKEVIAVVELGGSPGSFVESSRGIAWVAGFAGGIRRYEVSTLAILTDPSAPELAGPGYSGIAEDPVTGIIWAVNFEMDLLVAIEPDTGSLDDAWWVGDGPVDVWVHRPPDE